MLSAACSAACSRSCAYLARSAASSFVSARVSTTAAGAAARSHRERPLARRRRRLHAAHGRLDLERRRRHPSVVVVVVHLLVVVVLFGRGARAAGRELRHLAASARACVRSAWRRRALGLAGFTGCCSSRVHSSDSEFSWPEARPDMLAAALLSLAVDAPTTADGWVRVINIKPSDGSCPSDLQYTVPPRACGLRARLQRADEGVRPRDAHRRELPRTHARLRR